MKYVVLIAVTYLSALSFNVQALECEVKYIAKKTESDGNWLSSIRKTRVKSGLEEGKGKTKSECRDSALSKIIKDSWEITSEKIKVK